MAVINAVENTVAIDRDSYEVLGNI